jgi:hypothetical protein
VSLRPFRALHGVCGGAFVSRSQVGVGSDHGHSMASGTGTLHTTGIQRRHHSLNNLATWLVMAVSNFGA